ncbi:shikimate dehydrogenase [Aureliella helgolandensis]|uniref:Multifunctional fusion protein n=1 Tax=Aureliella helgolandensis TaxID=2527968 RepID=A0A518G4F0_9BACT|nr:shikimate dehydrogenase [Aureliella helgolandensis]QDV23468.1 Shikimate dehydrogenase [Aureliella helgolandensis]
MLCVTIGRSRHKAMIAEYQFLAEKGADLVEMRLDYIGRHIDLTRLLANRPCPVVVTCRRKEDGGRWDKSEEERLMILRNAIASGVDFVDLEEDVAGSIPRYGATKRIVSLHNFEFTPNNLEEIHGRLADLDADVVKIATMANSFTDCIRMLRLVESAKVPTIGLCMGDTGVITRVLGLRYGSPFTYTTMSSERKIAPGQVTFDTMRDVYRAKEIDADTKLFGVVADPVSHSLSPQIHNAAFKHDNLNYRYLPFRIAADELPLFLQWCKETGVGGLSVTIPHKEAMLELMSQAESATTNIGAINTVAIDGNEASGYNTDYRAAMDCLQEALSTQNTMQKKGAPPGQPEELFRGRGALIMGAGGVARAIAYGLRQRGAVVTIASRTEERAKKLARDIGGKAISWEARYSLQPGILVNCTPIGMHPDVDSTPYDKAKLLNETIVFDTVYNPEHTLLIKDARAAGCFVVNGLDMFVRQAAYQYKLFTGLEPPSKLMRETVKKITSPVKF